jgi:AraC-like DNA-binding protein
MGVQPKTEMRLSRRSAPAAPVPLCLFDPRRGDAAFSVRTLHGKELQLPRRSNYFAILWIRAGSGIFHIDLNAFEFRAPALLFVSPYQTFFLEANSRIQGARLEFHANFFCIETYHEEVGCNGVLFNDAYGQPVLTLSPLEAEEVENMILQMERELSAAGLAHSEIIISYLKVFLIKASRSKVERTKRATPLRVGGKASILEDLAALIERHYRMKHSPADYGRLLHITPKALGKIVRRETGKSLTGLIRERVLRHAKWQLLHTRKPIKEVAAEVGFADELYFSRIFKRATGFSPRAFREFETAIRGG